MLISQLLLLGIYVLFDTYNYRHWESRPLSDVPRDLTSHNPYSTSSRLQGTSHVPLTRPAKVKEDSALNRDLTAVQKLSGTKALFVQKRAPPQGLRPTELYGLFLYCSSGEDGFDATTNYNNFSLPPASQEAPMEW
jgi:hypothetical protein